MSTNRWHMGSIYEYSYSQCYSRGVLFLCIYSALLPLAGCKSSGDMPPFVVSWIGASSGGLERVFTDRGLGMGLSLSFSDGE